MVRRFELIYKCPFWKLGLKYHHPCAALEKRDKVVVCEAGLENCPLLEKLYLIAEIADVDELRKTLEKVDEQRVRKIVKRNREVNP